MNNRIYTKPNFFILGAAKCGTTTLYNTLINHKEIYLPIEKEPSFLSSDQDKHINSIVKYFQLFDDVEDEKAIGEAPPNYLTDPYTPGIIKSLFPKAKLIVTLRNPAEKAHAMFLNLKRDGYESYNTFEEAIKDEEKRFYSKKFKEKNQYFYHFLYYRSSLFGQQIKRYLDFFPKEQLHIITLNDLKNNSEKTIKSVLAFLEVDNSIDLKMGDTNKGYDIRFVKLQKVQRSLPRKYRMYLDPLVKLTKKPKPKINPTTKAMLMERYEPDLKLLYDLTNIDLR